MHYLNFGPMGGGLPFFSPTVIIFIMAWSLFWKGLALWQASKRHEPVWFVVLLVVNTAGILEMVYYFGVAKKKLSDVLAIFGAGKKG